MFMQLLKFVSKIRVASVCFAVASVYFIYSSQTPEVDVYSYFQHPYITMALISGYWFLVFQFDFTGSMFTSRFMSLDSRNSQVIKWLTFLSIAYTFAAFLLFYMIGLFTKDIFTFSKVFIYLVSNALMFLLLNTFYIAFSVNFTAIIARIIVLAMTFFVLCE